MRRLQEDPDVAKARRLDAQGRSREACALLRSASDTDPRHPGRELLGEWLLRDGRSAHWLEIYAEHEDVWAQVPRLRYMQAMALHKLGRYRAAQEAYEGLLALARTTAPEWVPYAEGHLKEIQREFALRGRAADARGEANLLSLLGLAGLGAMGSILFIISRRKERLSES